MAKRTIIKPGDILVIPVNDSAATAKVIFASSYFKDVILIKLLQATTHSDVEAQQQTFDENFDLYYTGAQPIKKGRWRVIDSHPVSEAENSLTKRTSGGEVWLEDTHLGPASDRDLQTLPKMEVYGAALIEKYAARSATI
jgi:hypothetical protein